MVDATPDIRSQAEDLIEAAGVEPGPGRILDGILITHAHVGHYAGLVHLGREAMATRSQPVLASPRMCAFLRSNKPWSRLVEWGHVELRPLKPAGTADLGGGLTVSALAVPHRDEDSDTVGYILDGGTRRILYVPDTDAWERWPRSLESVLANVDVAFLDGTFFDGGEIPGRDPAEIPHPLIRRTMDRLGERSTSISPRVIFTHLNHSNPAMDPRSPAAEEILRRGYEVAAEGMELPL
jgi:pyrroloquinoline quinone biosynthesis protein B